MWSIIFFGGGSSTALIKTKISAQTAAVKIRSTLRLQVNINLKSHSYLWAAPLWFHEKNWLYFGSGCISLLYFKLEVPVLLSFAVQEVNRV